MLADDLVTHGQTQPQPAGFPCAGAVHLVEALEDALLVLRLDAHAVVGYGQGHGVVVAGQGDQNFRLGVADGVVE